MPQSSVVSITSAQVSSNRTVMCPGFPRRRTPRYRLERLAVVRVCSWVWMVVWFVCVIRVPVCARVSRVCPGSPRCLFTGRKGSVFLCARFDSSALGLFDVFRVHTVLPNALARFHAGGPATTRDSIAVSDALRRCPQNDRAWCRRVRSGRGSLARS